MWESLEATDAVPPQELVERGRQLFLRSQLDSATLVLRSALRVAESLDDRGAESDALVWLAYSEWQSGELAEARARGREALNLKVLHGLPDVWRAYNILGLVAWWESRNTEAVDLYRRGLDALPGDEEEGLATLQANLALVLFEFGDFDGAREGFEAMRVYGARSEDGRLEGNALINLAMLDVQVGDPSAALPLLERARALHESEGSVTGVEFAVGHLATAYAAMGELGRAYATFDTALTITRENGLRAEEAENLAQLAGLHAAASDVRRALTLYAESRAINEEIGLEDRIASGLREEAVLLAQLGNLPEARARAEEAWRIHLRVAARMEAERDLIVLAELAQEEDDTDGMERHLKEARAVAESIGARVALAEVAVATARIAERDDDFQRVLAVLAEHEPSFKDASYAMEWEAESLRARAFLGLGRLVEAEAAGRRAVAVTERVRSGLASGVLRSSYAAARLDTYATLVRALLSQGRTADALQVADAARGHVLDVRPTSGGDVGDLGTTSVMADGEEILRRIDNLVESLELYLNDPSDEARETAGELGQRLADARADYERYLIRRSELRGPVAGAPGPESLTAARLQDALGETEVALEYLVTPEELIVFIVTPDALRVLERDISADNLASRVRLARELLTEPGGNGRERAVLERLHGLLIQPALETGLLDAADRLVVIPHESLTYLPFAALRDARSGRYLVEDYETAQAPSARSLTAVRARPSMRPPVAAGAAMAPFPETLAASREEASRVSESWEIPGFFGVEATESRLRHVLKEDGVVHVATHGVMNPLNPMFSRIELRQGQGGSADDGRLEVHELLELGVEADLVFLSGCETALGGTWSTDFARGEDFATLAEAFLSAGAGIVVASLWRLQDPAAARFAELFYAELDDAGPVGALARAQRAMMGDIDFSAPFHWASYQIAGGR